MRSSFVSAAFLAFASSVLAQNPTPGFDTITSPTDGQRLVAGQPFDIIWQPGNKPEYLNGTATIVLLQGKDAKSLQVGDTIVAGVKNSAGKYTWNVPSNAPAAQTYGLRITLDDDETTQAKEDTIFQYSFPFFIAQTQSSGTTTVRLGTGTAYTPVQTSTSLIVTANTTSTTTAVSSATTISSNFTLTTSTTRSATRSPSPTTSGPAQQTANAAVAKTVSGGLALIGAVLAFAL